MKNFFLIFIFLFIILGTSVYAKDSSFTGFLSGQIWYSPNSFIEGDTIKIYTAIWNGDDSSLTAKVEFYDKNVILGMRNILIPAHELQGVSINWKVTSGDHIISAKIISSTLDIRSGKKETIVVSRNTTNSNHRFIPVVVKVKDGQTFTSGELINNEFVKVGNKINKILPISVGNQVSSGINSIDNFRNQTLAKIISSEGKTKNELLSFKEFTHDKKTIAKNNNLKPVQTIPSTKNLMEVTNKPITQIKLFFLKILNFIFSDKIVFYGLIFLIIFYLLRKIYRKVMNK